MTIRLGHAKLSPAARVKRYQRPGGGTRLKDYGYAGQTLSIPFVSDDARDDLDEIHDWLTDRRERTLKVPVGDGKTRTYKVLISRAPHTYTGGNTLRGTIEAEVVD